MRPDNSTGRVSDAKGYLALAVIIDSNTQRSLSSNDLIVYHPRVTPLSYYMYCVSLLYVLHMYIVADRVRPESLEGGLSALYQNQVFCACRVTYVSHVSVGQCGGRCGPRKMPRVIIDCANPEVSLHQSGHHLGVK